jgi:hypothetical protein
MDIYQLPRGYPNHEQQEQVRIENNGRHLSVGHVAILY